MYLTILKEYSHEINIPSACDVGCDYLNRPDRLQYIRLYKQFCPKLEQAVLCTVSTDIVTGFPAGIK